MMRNCRSAVRTYLAQDLKLLVMLLPKQKNVQAIWRHLLSLILVLSLACLWVLLAATPAIAQANTINYSNTQLENRDFSHADLVCGVFVAAEMRGANFEGANLTNAIFKSQVASRNSDENFSCGTQAH